MGLCSLCFAFLLFSPVLANLNEEISIPNGTLMVHKKDTIKEMLTNHRVESSEMIEQNSTLVVARTPEWNKRPSNKPRNNRVNQLNQKGRRPSDRNRRPPNEKKGYKKKARQPNKIAIQYLARSPRTDKLNKAVDDMLACMSQTLSTQNSTISLRLNTFRANMKISPWAFVALNKTYTNQMVEFVMDGKRRRTRSASDSKSETAEIDATGSYDDYDDALIIVEGTTLIDSVTENSYDVGESSTIPEEVTVPEDDDVDDSTETYISDNITQSEQDIATEYHRTKEPSPVVLSDGSIEYSLQLLSGFEIENKELGIFEEELPEQQDNVGRQAKKSDDKRGRNVPRNYSRRPSVKVEGIGLIQRNGDILMGMRQNSTAHIIETHLLIGPLQCVMDKKAGLLLQQSRVSLPQLSAKLRLTEIDGKLVEIRLRPTKIRPNKALVTLRLSENGNVPSHMETARLVSYLSREMTRIWNSGYLLRRVKRQFKQLFVDETVSKGIGFKHEEARKLVQTLTFAAFEELPSADTGKDSKEFSKS